MITDQKSIVFRGYVPFVIIFLSAWSFVGCMSHAERKYLASIYGSSGIVRVHAMQTDSAWSLAKWFGSTYATDSIIEMSDTVITTKLRSSFERMFWHNGYGYRVTRRTPQDSV